MFINNLHYENLRSEMPERIFFLRHFTPWQLGYKKPENKDMLRKKFSGLRNRLTQILCGIRERLAAFAWSRRQIVLQRADDSTPAMVPVRAWRRPDPKTLLRNRRREG